MKIGDFAETRRAFGEDDIAALARLSGAPAVDQAVPEALINALFSYLLGVKLPGRGTNYLKQQTRYLRPVAANEALTARVQITRIRPEKHLVDLATTCRDGAGALVAEGRALVLVKDVSRPD
ncbi:MAG: phosphate acetyltransferase [Maricaulaceae bacterium]|nr:phosphate acetyltransferase [Maricaulaceae bacterium]